MVQVELEYATFGCDVKTYSYSHLVSFEVLQYEEEVLFLKKPKNWFGLFFYDVLVLVEVSFSSLVQVSSTI